MRDSPPEVDTISCPDCGEDVDLPENPLCRHCGWTGEDEVVGTLVSVNLPYACYGVIVVEDRIVQAAPIAKWAVGKSLSEFTAWVSRKGGTAVVCG